MNIVEPFIVKMKSVNKSKINQALVHNALALVKEFPFVCGIDIEMTRKHKKFTKEAWKFAQTILELFSFIPNDSYTLGEIFQVLIIIGSFNNDLPDSPNYKIIVSMILDNIKDEIELHTQLSFLSTLCMFPTFVKSFFFAPYFPDFVEKMMTDESQTTAFSSFIEVFSRVVKFPTLQLPKIINIIQITLNNVKQNKFTVNTIGNTAEFISSWIEKASTKNPTIFKKFEQMDGIKILYQALKSNPSKSTHLFFKALLKSYTDNSKHLPNIVVSDFISTILREKADKSTVYLLHTIADIINDPSIDLLALDNSIHFDSLFTSKELIELSEIIKVISSLVNRKYDHTTEIILSFFSSDNFAHKNKELEHVISNASNSNLIVITPENNSQFEDFFVNQNAKYNISELLSENQAIFDLFLKYYTVTPEKQLSLLDFIYSLSSNFSSIDKFVTLISNLLSINYNNDKIKLFSIKFMKHFSLPLFSSLANFFKISSDNVSIFLSFGGFSILKHVFERTDLPDENITDMLIAMSNHPFNHLLNESIMKLSKNHRFFRLSKECYRRLIYDIKRTSPIRLPVFLPFLDYPLQTEEEIDLINQALYSFPVYRMIGKELPNLDRICNISVNLKTSISLVENYDLFKLTSNENSNQKFPFFEFLPCHNSFIEMDIPFLGISFWFKTSHKYPSQFVIFKANDVLITWQMNVLTLKWGNNERTQTFQKPDDWHFVFISSSGWMYSEMVNVIVDDIEYKFEKDELFSKIYFGDNEQNNPITFKIAANIRIYESLFQDVSHIRQVRAKGPSNFELNQFENLIYFSSKSSNLLKDKFILGNSVILVESRPLSSYLDYPLFLSKVFDRLQKSETPENLTFNVLSLLTLFKQNGFKNEQFWYYLIIYLKNAKKLNVDVYDFIIDFLTEKLTPDKISDVMRSMFLDTELWFILKEEDKVKLMKQLFTVLTTTLKEFVSQQNWMPFLLRQMTLIKNEQYFAKFSEYLIKTAFVNADKNVIVSLLTLINYESETPKFNVYPIYSLNLFFNLSMYDDLAVELIPPNFLSSFITFTNNDRKSCKGIELFQKLRTKKSDKFNISLSPTTPKFIGNLVFFYHAWSTICDDLIIDLTQDFSIVYENCFSFLLSVQMINFSALMFSRMTNQNIQKPLLEAVSNGFKVLTKTVETNPSLFANRNNTFIICFIASITFALLNSKKEKIVTDQIQSKTINFSGLYEEDFNTISSSIFDTFSIEDSYKGEFLNKREFVKAPKKSFHPISNYLELFKSSLNESNIKTDINLQISNEEIYDFLKEICYLDFIAKIAEKNKESTMSGQIVSFCIGFEPFCFSDFAAYSYSNFLNESGLSFHGLSLDIIATSLFNILNDKEFTLLQQKQHKNKLNAEKQEEKIEENIDQTNEKQIETNQDNENSDNNEKQNETNEEKFNEKQIEKDEENQQGFIEENPNQENERKEFDKNLFVDLILKICKLSSETIQDNLFEIIPLRVLPYIDTSKSMEILTEFYKDTNKNIWLISCLSAVIIQSDLSRFLTQITQKENFKSFFSNKFPSYSLEKLSENTEENVEILNEIEKIIEDDLIKKRVGSELQSFERISVQVQNLIFSSNSVALCYSKLAFPLLQKLFDYITFTSLRQTECFVVSVWQNEYQALPLSENDTFSESSLVKPFNSSLVLHRNLKLLSQSEEDSLLCNHVFNDEGSKNENTTFLPKIENLDISKFTKWVLPNNSVLFSSFLKRFFKFGNFKGTVDACVESMNVILFMFSPAILVLFGSKCENSGIYFSELNKEFVEKIANGQYGQFTSFCGHPVLIFNPYDVIEYLTTKNSLILFRLNSSVLKFNFNLQNSLPKSLIETINNGKNYLIKKISPTFINKTKSVSESSSLWSERKISSVRFLFDINYENILMSSPMKYPSSIHLIPELSQEKKFSIEDSDIINFCKEMNIKVKPRISCYDKKFINDIEINKVKEYKVKTKNGMIICNKNSSIVNITSNYNSSEVTTLQLPEFIALQHLNISEDYDYISADFNYGIVTVYLVNYNNENIVSLTPVSSLPLCETPSITALCSQVYLAASAHLDQIWFWNFARGYFIRKVSVMFSICGLAFDSDQTLWVWGTTQICCLSLNGTFLGAYNCDRMIENVKPLPDRHILVLQSKGIKELLKYQDGKLILVNL